MDRVVVMAAAREVDDARVLALFQQRDQQVGQEEMAQVIGSELQLEAVGGAVERAGHHSGVVDVKVNRAESGQRLLRRGADRGERGEVADQRFDPRAGLVADRLCCGFELGFVAARKDQIGPSGAHRARGFVAQAGIGAGDEGGPPGEVVVGEDVVRRAVETECAHVVISEVRKGAGWSIPRPRCLASGVWNASLRAGRERIVAR